MGALVRSAFRFPRAPLALGVQVKRSVFLKRRYRGRPLSPRREMKRLRATRHPMTLCTPFKSLMGPMLVMAAIFSGLASMPRSEMMNPRSMPRRTPKTHFFGEAIQVGDEGFGLSEGLSVLHAFHVALVSVAVRGSDGDDSLGARHLELEVIVVGDGHELGVARSSQHRVIGPSEPNYLEG